MAIISSLAAIGTAVGVTSSVAASAAVGGLAVAGVAGSLASTGFQIASGIDQANQAAKQRRREAAIQDKATTKEEAADRAAKAKKKAARFQAERAAVAGTPAEERGRQNAGLLSSAPGAKQGL